MKTEPQEMAAKSAAASAPLAKNCERTSAEPSATPSLPAAVAANVRYVGALSRKLDRMPLPQKYSHGSFMKKCPRSGLKPWPHAFRICRAGVIVMKIPTNNTATSTIGPNVNLLAWRLAGDVVT